MYSMASACYEAWYKTKVSPRLSEETKKIVAKRVSNLSLEIPIFQPNISIDKSKVPELASFTKLEKYTSLLLYVVLTEISKELGLSTESVSEIAKNEGI